MKAAVFFVLFYTLISGLISPALAQTCPGNLGAPVLNETFGAGPTYGIGPSLSDAGTNLQYFADACAGPDTDIPAGTYTINTELPGTCKGGTWLAISHDHTGDKYGYMMVINAAEAPSVFYDKLVPGNTLCPGTNYFFGAWIMNILKDEAATQGYIEPNITFTIRTPAGVVLKMVNTGDIKANTQPIWIQYGALFTSPTDGSDVVVEIKNNAPGGNGNDLAMDDITFSPCGPVIQTGFTTITDTASRNICAHDNYNYTLVSAQSGYTDPGYQWQINKNDGTGWVNVPGATSPTLQVSGTDAPAATLQYRVGLLNRIEAGSESCRIYSFPLTINIYAQTSFMLPAVTTACIGQPLTLTSTDGDTFQWSGPNNFSSSVNDITVTETATPAYDGVYTLTIVKDNCPLFQTTTVQVIEAPVLQLLSNVTICQGDQVQLNLQSQNATHFKWLPATGLNQDDIANPVASPAVTTTYTVTATNDGCPYFQPYKTVTVTVVALPGANAGPDIKLFEGQHATLQGMASGDSISYFWTPATYLSNPLSLNPVTTPTDNITYTLHVNSEAGCGMSMGSIFVRVYKKLGIPNTFTPNNDGTNDVWNLGNIDTYPGATVSIFNRFGQQVFYSIDYPKAWNGLYNGSPLPWGTYYYIIDLKVDNLPKIAGWVLILR